MQIDRTATSSAPPQGDAATLAASWKALRDRQPQMRIREAAAQLGVAEAQLLATRCGQGAIRLQGDWRDVLRGVPALGRVMALTRNEHCVHERHGAYGEPSFDGHVGLVLGEEIDLRLFMGQWALGFAVEEAVPHGTRRSLQFFDRGGQALHKIYLTDSSDAAAYARLVEAFAAADQAPVQPVEAPAPRAADRPDAEIDVAALRAGWAALKDTHDFFPLLRRHKVGRHQALRLAGPDFARRLAPRAARATLEAAAESGLPIMVFVGNPGVIQIHTGPVSNLRPTGPWFNVLDPAFNLHLREDRIADVWHVRKPTSDGDVNSIELFDAAGEQIALMFGKRKPGQPESPAWQALAAAVAAHHPAVR